MYFIDLLTITIAYISFFTHYPYVGTINLDTVSIGHKTWHTVQLDCLITHRLIGHRSIVRRSFVYENVPFKHVNIYQDTD